MRNFSVLDYARTIAKGDWSDGVTRSWDLGAGRSLTYDVSGLTAQEKGLARGAVAEWSAISGIRFIEVKGGADITYVNTGTRAHAMTEASGNRLTSATVEIASSKVEPGDGVGSYSFRTYLHETGHALGLAHPQDYGVVKETHQGAIRNDSWQMSVMSYFSQTENPYVKAGKAYPITLMQADIKAIELLYDRPAAIHAGNTRYGDKSNAGGTLDQATRLGPGVAMTIADTSGNDTISFRGTRAAQEINLNAGSVSNVQGGQGNLVIAPGTRIENAIGGAGNDRLLGNGAANMLDGQKGRDFMAGGRGNDRYLTDGRDVIAEARGGGIDTVHSTASYALAANVEHLKLVGNAVKGVGNNLDNRITGNDANNILNGGTGRDLLVGGRGNDVYHVNGGDRTVEGARGGIDTVVSTAFHSLQTHVENLVLGGGAAINGVGNALNNRLTGNANSNVLVGQGGNDVLKGGGGRDVLKGGTGNDVYHTDGGDRIVERPGDGYDTVLSSAFHRVQPGIEKLVLTGSMAVNAIGSDGADRMFGNAAGNVMLGGGGNDVIDGGGGNDRLNGGVGNDVLTGRGGADLFQFTGGRDVIRDFADDADRIMLDNTLWGGSGGVDEALARTTIVNGRAVINFGDGNVLQVHGVGNAQQLADDLVIF